METLSQIVDTIQEKLGKEESSKISDNLASILVIEEANAKTIKEKDSTISKYKNDKEYYNHTISRFVKGGKSSVVLYKNDKDMLIEANGNLLKQQAQIKEEDSFFEDNSKPRITEPFDFRSVFDSKGNFKR